MLQLSFVHGLSSLQSLPAHGFGGAMHCPFIHTPPAGGLHDPLFRGAFTQSPLLMLQLSFVHGLLSSQLLPAHGFGGAMHTPAPEHICPLGHGFAVHIPFWHV
jgi:hypothetical protein